jgi:hypothetical protein
MGQMKNAHNMLVGKPEGKKPLGGSGHSWEDNVKMNLREIGW